METRDMLSQYEYPGNDVPVIRGSALKAFEGEAEWEGKIIELADRGTVGQGPIQQGIIHVGDAVDIVGIKETISTTYTGLKFRILLDESRAGDNCAVLLRGIKREDIQQGQVIAKPGSIMPHTQFEAAIYALSEDEGGRSSPFFRDDHPQLYMRTIDISGTLELPKDVESVLPGDLIHAVVTLVHPIAMEGGLRFAMREGGRTVGTGVISKIVSLLCSVQELGASKTPHRCTESHPYPIVNAHIHAPHSHHFK
ncbi:MAG: hypothetical protein Q9211_002626 [Gyalolechia sp. 1 TL-2023]